MNPALLLADEPPGNLDTKRAEEVFALLRRFNGEHGTTVLFVTDNAAMADRCDKTIQVIDGRVTGSAGAGGPLACVGGDTCRDNANQTKAGRSLSAPARQRPGDSWRGCSPLHSSGQRSRFAISFDLEMRWSLHLSLKLMASPRELYDAMQPTFSQTTSKPPFDIRLME